MKIKTEKLVKPLKKLRHKKNKMKLMRKWLNQPYVFKNSKTN